VIGRPLRPFGRPSAVLPEVRSYLSLSGPSAASAGPIARCKGKRASGRPRAGPAVAFVAEFLISFGLMLAVLIVSNTLRAARFTGLFAGALMAAYFVVERPYSGMSIPARTFASAVPAQVWTGLWLYFAAPLLGMAAAGEVYLLSFGRVYCAKLHHDNDKRCIFHHGHENVRKESPVQVPPNLAIEPARTDVRAALSGRGAAMRPWTGRLQR
jgi:hypothetical protein